MAGMSMRDIKRKIKSLKGTQRITAAMKAVSAAKLKKAEAELKKIRNFARILREITLDLASFPEAESVFLKKDNKPTKQVLICIFGSDKGLCGAFNSNLIKTARNKINQLKEKNIEVELLTVGNKVTNYFEKYTNIKVKYKWTDVFRKVGEDLAKEIYSAIINAYLEEGFDEIHIVFNKFINPLRQDVIYDEFLPIKSPQEKQDEDVVGMEVVPSYEILDNLVKDYTFAWVLNVLWESATSEHAARMTAMDNATNNIKDLIKKLTISYNKARQAAITKELIEITNAIEAMK